MKLVAPSKDFKKSYLQAVAELENDGRDIEVKRLKEKGGFEELLRYFADLRAGKNLPEGFVSASELWLIDNNRFIGQLSLRHELTDYLQNIGGHIGYVIRPSERGKGYGTKILELGLNEAKKLGINKILITCNKNNVPSKKIIKKNGGAFEDEREDTDGVVVRRHWINL